MPCSLDTVYRHAVIDLEGNMTLFVKVKNNDRKKAVKELERLNKRREKGKEGLSVCLANLEEKRSIDANAYFHVLVGKIAKESGASEEEVKTDLVLNYGEPYRDDAGKKSGFMLPEEIKVETVYKYSKWFGKRIIESKWFNCYMIYKPTHELERAEMTRLIDGTVREAKSLDIETRTPEEIETMMERSYEKQAKQSV